MAAYPLREPVDRAIARARWLPMACAMGALLLVYASWQVFRSPIGDHRLIGDLFFYPVGVAAISAAIGASRRCREQPRLRSAWRLLALAAFSYLAGDVAQTVYEQVGTLPYPSAADIFYLLFYPLTLCGLLRFPTGYRNLGERVRLTLDLAVVAIGGAMVVICVVLGPTVLQSGPDKLLTAISVAYPVGDMVLLVGLASVLLRRAPGSSTRALQLMAATLMFFVAADVIYGYLNLHSTYQGGNPVDSLWMVAIALSAVSATAQVAPEPGLEEIVEHQRERASWAPFLAVAVGFGVMLAGQLSDRNVLQDTMVLAAVLLATLVSVRQFLAQRDLVHTRGRLSYQSLHDELTALPNRALVIDRAEQMLYRSRRSHSPMAALCVDIDGFKNVNERFGRAAGDELLRVVAARLSGVARDADTVGRLSGDEFAVLLEGSTLDITPELVAERIRDVVGQPIDLHGSDRRTLSVTASTGVALGERSSADDLLRDADYALQEAKRQGKNCWVVFESSMQTAVQDRLELEMDLRQALERDELFLLYQPTIDLRSETIKGVEALVRWRHPRRGLIGPDVFIPLAEDCGMIVAIGRWVLRAACEQAAQWESYGFRLGMSINVSARQLDDGALLQDVAQALQYNQLDPLRVTLEITETALMRDAEAAAGRLRELKGLGVRIAIDDFGTGYSSLAYLRRFPVDSLKIDRAFISGIDSSEESRALVHTLVQLGKTLGLETLGEGIEEQAQLSQLQREQCDTGQGFLFSRPLPPGELLELLELDFRSRAVARP
jgi:diguanylate cyclase (GGDEF)-like protein